MKRSGKPQVVIFFGKRFYCTSISAAEKKLNHLMLRWCAELKIAGYTEDEIDARVTVAHRTGVITVNDAEEVGDSQVANVDGMTKQIERMAQIIDTLCQKIEALDKLAAPVSTPTAIVPQKKTLKSVLSKKK